MYLSAYDYASPENYRYVDVEVWVWISGVENPIREKIQVFEGEENDERAIKDALNRTDVEEIEIIN